MVIEQEYVCVPIRHLFLPCLLQAGPEKGILDQGDTQVIEPSQPSPPEKSVEAQAVPQAHEDTKEQSESTPLVQESQQSSAPVDDLIDQLGSLKLIQYVLVTVRFCN